MLQRFLIKLQLTNFFQALTEKLPAGVGYMLLSALSFSMMAVCVKAVSLYGIPVLEIVAARSLVSLVLSYIDIKRKRISIWGNNKVLLLARGGVGALSLICVYYAVITLPLAEATVLQYTYPVFTALIALWVLKENIQLASIYCFIISISGLAVMVSPDIGFDSTERLSLFSIVVALIGAFGSAVAYVIVRALSRSDDVSVIIIYFPLIAFPLSVLMLGDDFIFPDIESAALLILVGIFTQIGQFGLTKAMSVEKAGKVVAYSYIQVVFAVLFGWWVFSETPTLWTVLGGAMVILGALVNTLYKK
ncbi:DMT family transporter [Aliamphritea hakodatensis]|uniref:DMT family transporter n=1 Tax=Aliamphritea hakodatensis TaxID=2895352 RepID=UPI0022FD5F77|nr:DMT family transporter [Aliamphritea hakodatensis]